jgi:hypothetical protein
MNTVITTFAALRDVEQMIEVSSSMGDALETRNLIRERNRLRNELSNVFPPMFSDIYVGGFFLHLRD